MDILGNLFGTKYDDEKLCAAAEKALSEDPILNNPGSIAISSQEGVILLDGSVHSEREKAHVDDLVRTALDSSSLDYQRVENQLRVV